MNTYEIKSTDGRYIIKANHWSVGYEGLKFYKDEEMVAWFTTWDFWILVDKNKGKNCEVKDGE